MKEKLLKIKTKYGNATIKLFFNNGILVDYEPDYNECKEIAKGFNTSVEKVYQDLQEYVKKYLQSI
ncbi:hypothetical protein [Caldisalinibacter kiritimatiensis]|uniref:Uncharacterized protein n=1 Tax=Caldisalinibacter kiritimatiensis TaxID=1304284 RepID=R1ASM9_9FIRM|nr:hypothetical protein [Caldisalinibacter kiritimatiensis]EOD00168.1 hypothetical protein L21TH_1819 [Caldisalinibacter kiritimatiensis]